MVKIKVKKEFTLPELIEWGWESDFENMFFCSGDGSEVHFEQEGHFNTEEYIAFNETFEVEVEEEITEDTEIPVLIKLFEVSKIPRTRTSINSSIKEELEIVEKFGFNDPKAFYMLNSDSTATLLWKDGEMVE
ncbi:hypothetical protein [Staphylococcus hyicus]|uniref:hypothetical protein n=1 Tax=Staphylococcus hyicus TaxID=1284 RepID=UPI0023671EC1|nr:hypothetical protein [Staphylococcus hyicus]